MISNYVWKNFPFILGVDQYLFYVSAEVSVGSLIVNFLNLLQIAALTFTQLARYLSFYWGAMIGRVSRYLCVN